MELELWIQILSGFESGSFSVASWPHARSTPDSHGLFRRQLARFWLALSGMSSEDTAASGTCETTWGPCSDTPALDGKVRPHPCKLSDVPACVC